MWLVARPFSLPLAVCYAIALSGASVLPYALLWAVLQGDLLGDAPARALASCRRWWSRSGEEMERVLATRADSSLHGDG